MSKRIEPMEVICDAPAYTVVKACSQLGFQNPEDVRWCRMNGFFSPSDQASWGELIRQPLKVLAGKTDHKCSCGQFVPRLERYQFTMSNGTSQFYHLGQCLRCRTMYWEKE
jgi:hypothetical protein